MKTFKNIKSGLVLLILSYAVIGCSKMDDPYKEFIKSGEITYSKRVDTVISYPGHNRIKLLWVLTEAPNVNDFLIFWRNGKDSVVVPVNAMRTDTNSVIIENLNEGRYSFEIRSRDDESNTSLGYEVVGTAYGSSYENSLTNRKIQRFLLQEDVYLTEWYAADTTNVFTEVKFTDKSGSEQVIYLHPDTTILALPASYDPSQPLYARSTYRPKLDAIDSFVATEFDSFKPFNIEVGKGLWTAVQLKNDAGFRSGNGMEWMWDGRPAGFPQVFYTDGKSMPCTFTFDMGSQYKELSRMQQWGRTEGYNNAKSYEVWGIADTTGASTNLLPTDAGWADESRDKGWTLLAEVDRTDNGIAGWVTEIAPGHPPVRFIRMRILSTTTGSTNVHLSELSFWHNP